MRYRIGEIAEFFGLTKEGIRFLERKGMITSKRNEKNGYRYYGRQDISLLKHIRSYCSMGFSLDEAYHFLCDIPHDEVISRLDEKLEELSRKEEQLRRMKLMLKEQRQAAKWAVDAGSEYELCMNPELVFYPRFSDTYTEEERQLEKKLIAAMPPVMMMAECDELGRGVKGSAVRYQEVQELELPLVESTQRKTPRLCVHGVLEAPLAEMPDLTPMREWAWAHGVEQCDSAMCLVQVTYRHKDGKRWTIHEVYMPVCQISK